MFPDPPDPPDPPEVWVIYFFHNQRGKNRYRQGQRNHCFIQTNMLNAHSL